MLLDVSLALQVEFTEAEKEGARDEEEQVDHDGLGDAQGTEVEGVLQQELKGEEAGAGGHEQASASGDGVFGHSGWQQEHQCQCEQ